MKTQHLSAFGLAISIALLTACQSKVAVPPTSSTPVSVTKPRPVNSAASLMRLDFQKLNSDKPEVTAQMVGRGVGAQSLTNVPAALSAKVLSANTFTYGTKRHVRTTIEFTYNGTAQVNGPVILPVDTASSDAAKDTIGSSPFINVLYFDRSDARQKVLDGKLQLVRGKKYDTASQTAADDLDATPYTAQDLAGFTPPTFDGVSSITPYNNTGYQITGLPNNKLKQGDKFTAVVGLDVNDVSTPANDPFYASIFYLLTEGAPTLQESQGIDRTIGVTGDLSSLSLKTTDAGGGDIKIQNKTSTPITVTIPAPPTMPGQLKLNVGSALDSYSQTIPANQTATVPYVAECPVDEGTYTQAFDIKIGSEVKKSSVTVECATDDVAENDPLDTTKVLKPEDETQLLSYDEQANTARFAPGSSFAAGLMAGDVVVSDPIPNIAPEGLAFKIETISADKTNITFTDADLGELFQEANVDNELNPTFNDIDLKSSTFMPGITAMAGEGDTLLNLSFDQVLIGDKTKKDPNNYLIANGKLVVNKPKLVFKAQLNVPGVTSVNINEILTISAKNGGLSAMSEGQLRSMGWFSSFVSKAKEGISSVTQFATNTANQVASLGTGAYQAVSNLTQGVSFNSELYGEFTEQASLKIEGKADSKLTKKIPIGNVKFKPITLTLGFIPVTVTHELNLYIDINGQVTGEVKYNVEQSFTYKAGIKYDSKLSPKVQKINEVTPTFTQEFQLYGNFDLDAKAVAEYEAKLFGTFGAFANAKIGPTISARTQGDQLQLNGKICASGDAGTREFEFKVPVINTTLKLDGTNLNLFGNCFVEVSKSVKLPLVAKLEYPVDRTPTATSGITFDTVPEIDYGPAIPFKLTVVSADPNTTYSYQWALDGAALATGAADHTVNLPATEIGKEHTLTAVVSVGSDPNITLQKATKKITFKLKNSAPKVNFTSTDTVQSDPGQDTNFTVNVSDNNEQIDCTQVRWSSNAGGYELVSQGGTNGACTATLKFSQSGSANVFAQVTDTLNATTTAQQVVNIASP
ncbi:hypothetical protein FNU79_18045 [Deinococcus detaillensis]|uniref:Ig-like domain-containing protein n=1 Tax=Deinococcus detaillensis TaxID=2592048 RepID=A0A553UGQ3_9DEIO|nr:hypothetical protein [Deinococcus detaillensis]TSA79384.1 hypothetical protein FNU79_18045 [Deinococcus detaillensis]